MILTSIISAIPARAGAIFGLMRTEPLVYFPLIGLWAIFEIFYIVSNDDNDVREVDMLDNGISSIYVAIMISPLITNAGKFNLADFTSPNPRTILSMILFGYAMFLIITAFLKVLPILLVHLLGGCSIDTYLTFMALIYVDKTVAFDLTTAFVVALPMLIAFVIKTVRKVTG